MGKIKKCGVKEDLVGIIDRFENIQLLGNVVHAPTLEEQISALKEIPQSLPSGPTPETEGLLSALFQIVLKCGVKNPLRVACINVLHSVPENLKSSLELKFSDILMDLLSEELKIQNINHSVNFLTSWNNELDSRLSYLICDYFKRALEECLGKLRAEEGPQQRLDIIDCIHNCVRLTIKLSQKMSPKDTFKDLSRSLIEDVRLPLNVRSNGAILHVLSYETFEFDEFQRFKGDIDVFSELLLIYGPLSLASSGDLTLKPSDLEAAIEQIISIESNNSADCQLLLLSSRCMLLAVKSHSQTMSANILQLILDFIWCHLEHFMDSVRHLGLTTLNNLLEIGLKDGNQDIIDAIKRQIRKTPPERRSKHAGISALIGHVPIQDLVGYSDGLASSLLEAASSNSGINHAITSLESLMVQHYLECDATLWFEYWCEPLMAKIKSNGLNSGLERILTSAVRTHPEIANRIAELSKSDESYVCAFLTCAKAVIKFNLSPRTETLTQFLSECSYSGSDEIRMSCFALITESRKSSEIFSRDDLKIIKKIIFYNFDNHNLAVMQQTIAYFKKFIARFRESRVKLVKQKSSEALTDYDEFLDWLFQTCYDSLQRGASFPRRKTSLAVLDLCSESGFSWDWSEERSCVLLTLLADPYEEIKLTAKKLLAMSNKRLFEDAYFVKSYSEKALKMAAGIRPSDSATSAYYLGLLAESPEADFSFLPVDSAPEDNPSVYACVHLILDKLKRDKQVAETNLLKAASTCPLYGLIHVIRHLLHGINLRSLKIHDTELWRTLIEDLLDLLFDCNRLLTPIVNSASPEGHLPMDFDYDVSHLDESTPNVTSQMVLLCSWRTVKEVSLIFGDLVERLPIRSKNEGNLFPENDDGVLKEERVVEIGNHLSGLLCETKHRGAFELAFVGFCQVTSTMWRSSNPRLHKLPAQWIKDILDEISSNENLSSTRRSAGVPFIVQALICTQVELENKRFDECLSRLLTMSATDKPQTVSHALNILRALFRNSTLGELVSPYVAQGFTAAIRGFNSESWMVRNSATLLLSALMSRVFGVPRLKTTVDEISWKNKLTGRLFFQRYPSLFQVLFDHLSKASENLTYSAVYPVLLILGRLYLSSLEGTDSNLELRKFIPLVFKCSRSAIYKTRALAASAIVPLITPNLFESHLNLIFDEIAKSSQENYIHGLLLQVKELFRHNEKLLSETSGKTKWMSSIAHTLTRSRSHLTRACCLQLFHSANAELPIETLSFVQKDIHSPSLLSPGFDEYLTWIARHALKLNPPAGEFARLLTHTNYNVRRVASGVLSEILMTRKGELNGSEELAKIFASDLLNYRGAHHEDNLEILKISSIFPLVFKFVEHTSLIELLTNICDNGPASLGCLAMDCLISYLLAYGTSSVTPAEARQILKIIWDFSKDEANVECRRSAASFIGRLRSEFLPLLAHGEAYATVAFHWTVIRLVTDEDGSVRKQTGHCNGVPLRSVETYLKQMTDGGVQMEALTTCLWQSAVEFQELANDDDDDEDRVFDKCQTNNYLGGALFSTLYNSSVNYVKLGEKIANFRVIRLEDSILTGETEFHSPFESDLSFKDSESELRFQLFPLSNGEAHNLIFARKMRAIRSLFGSSQLV